MVEVIGVSKTYGGKPVVDNVSVQVPKGCITSFIGPNGAGKSTLLAMMSRLTKKDGGEIRIEGREIGKWDNNELAKKISILKQANHINIRLTVKDLVGFGRFPYSQGRLTKEDKRVIDESIDYMELGDMRDNYLDQLSGGQRQRAFISMVIAQSTEYILLDEPLNNLDMKHSVQIMRVLQKMVADLGKTIVLVLHDINFASCYSDRIVALKHGKVVREGAVDEMIQTPVLHEIYDMHIPIETIGGHKIAVYFA